MNIILLIVQIAISIALSIAILLQARGGGLGSAFGNAQYQHTRRGSDKVLFQVTIALGAAFVIVSLLNVFLS